MKAVPVLAITALLLACSQQPAATGSDKAKAARSPAPAPATLAGEWRVAGIDGEPLDEPYGIALTADAQEIWWEPRCAGMVLSYSIDGNVLMTGPRSSTPPAPTSTPAPVCLVGHPARLKDVSQALQLAERIEMTPANGVLISGGGHSLTLFSQ
ncbi:hypothetical protein [Aurantiacibacter marinus]|uniref:DUF306 domain-containing protein n=1 Tax=Aurantiacibacter marinus TaxID=874156 RepID=A0A0H0XSL8_9SPHN|nr:hypothetical protein [Aurantiacibacter marinus]KLI64937.1 hypothetical protein AAV99_05435 [Aurantiacibacter marinus]